MTDTFKKLGVNDSSHVRSLVHEVLPIDGAIAWSAYGTLATAYPVNTNVNHLAHGMFQSVYDYVYTNSSANHIFDLTLGVHADSPAFNTVITAPYAAAYDSQYDANGYKRQQIYNALAQRLCGFGTDGEILQFDRDGDFAGGGEKYTEVMAILFTRLLHKDGIKPGSFEFQMAMHPLGYSTATVPDDTYNWDGVNPTDSVITIADTGADTSYRTNSPAGRFAVLYATNPAGSIVLESTLLDGDGKVAVGLVFYDAGIVILTPWIFQQYDGGGTAVTDGLLTTAAVFDVLMLFNLNGNGAAAGDYTTTPPTDPVGALDGTTCYTITELVRGYEENPALPGGDVDLTIGNFCDAFRQRIDNIEFQNTTELNSTIYFCRANHDEFNYSSNPTYCDGSRIVNKDTSQDAPSSYITTVGLYASDGALLAVAKLSEPFKKSSDTDLSLRVRIDY